MSEISAIHSILYTKKNPDPRMDFTVVLPQTRTLLCCLPGEASLQRILLLLPCHIDLQQFKKTFEPRVHPQIVGCHRVGQHTNRWCLTVCPAKG